jgi:ATP-dependent Lon protease
MLSENGAKHILAPMENVDDIGSIPRDVHAQTDTVFYDSAQNLLQKAIVEA